MLSTGVSDHEFYFLGPDLEQPAIENDKEELR
jgi:hypothetical protein